MTIKDSYQQLFDENIIDKERLFTRSLEMIISCPIATVDKDWNEILERWETNSNLVVRSMGRQGNKSDILIDFYREYFGKTVIIDRTNNAAPRRMIQIWTGEQINITIQNYQIAHVFGRTKNPLTFVAPWNIVLIPKIVDPFTGHEARGDYVVEYSKLLKDFIYRKYGLQINAYNEYIEKLWDTEKLAEIIIGLRDKYGEKELSQVERQLLYEFELIKM